MSSTECASAWGAGTTMYTTTCSRVARNSACSPTWAWMIQSRQRTGDRAKTLSRTIKSKTRPTAPGFETRTTPLLPETLSLARRSLTSSVHRRRHGQTTWCLVAPVPDAVSTATGRSSPKVPSLRKRPICPTTVFNKLT